MTSLMLSLLCAALLSCSAETDIGASNTDCDPLMASQCGLPWPSNLYLVPDAARKTGYTLTFGPTTLPANFEDRRVDPTAYKRLDGYSVGTPVITRFPNIDISGMASEGAIERSMLADAQVLLFEVTAQGARRVPYFVELDSAESDVARQALILRPAEILKEATRYVVAFRGLKDTGGATIARSAAFQRLVDGTTADIAALSTRQARFDQTFQILEAQGVPRAQLTLAWDFITASSDAYHGDLLAMRDDALKASGEVKFTVTKVTEYLAQSDGSAKPVDENIAFQIEGQMVLPSYLKDKQFSKFLGSEINRDAAGRPARMGTRTLPFWLMVPRAALTGRPAGMVLYGHGLLGEGSQALSGFNRRIADQNNLVFFGTNLSGMTTVDVPSVVGILSELSGFVSLTDRLQQGIVDWVVFARAMRDQLGGLMDLSSRGVKIDKAQLFYSGISQGGIFGGTFLAVTPDITYGHLGVPGNNYSLLLHRSRDFNTYLNLMEASYSDPTDRLVLLGAMQLLWDSTDPLTHLRHITAQPHAGSKGPHYVLLGPARGDDQVAVVSNEILARTTDLQIPVMKNYDADRQPALLTSAEYGRRGSGIVLWSFGNPWPAPGNQPPSNVVPMAKACTKDADCAKAQECDTAMTKVCVWRDPHESPRRNDDHNRQMVNFFRTGQIIDVCNNAPCRP